MVAKPLGLQQLPLVEAALLTYVHFHTLASTSLVSASGYVTLYRGFHHVSCQRCKVRPSL
jgi:hypothetical protein